MRRERHDPVHRGETLGQRKDDDGGPGQAPQAGRHSEIARHVLTRPEHARRHTLLDVDGSLPLYRYWQDAAGGEELQFARVWRVGSGAAIHRLVREGEGVAVLPQYMVQPELDKA